MKLDKLSLSFLILICLYPDLAHALFTSESEYATFESFYKESSAINWIIAGAVAIAAGAAIIASGGTASPVVVSIGSSIGSLKGLSGATAAKWGLALLGGGAKASGGLGIAGGTALLTASLTFGTEIVFDYALGKATSEYSYNKLVEQSKKMPTLPLPVNDSGLDAYEDAIEILQGIDKRSPMFANSNQDLIRQAIDRIKTDKESLSWGEDEKIKNGSLLSLLYFYSSDYIKAKDHADRAIKFARNLEIKWTLPAFIYATSSLYEKEFDFPRITDEYFRYSILEEPNNQLIPFLFSIYLDRMLLRFHDNSLDETALHQIFTIIESPELKEFRMQNYTILLSRYFMRLKLEQQKITSLANTSSRTIKDSPKTLQIVNASFDSYKALLGDAKDILTRLKLERQNITDNSYKTLLRRAKNIMSDMLNLDLDDDDSGAHIANFDRLWSKYDEDSARLASTVDDLRVRVVETRSSARESVAAGIGLAILAILGMFVWRLTRQ